MLEYAQRIAHGGLPADAAVLEEASVSTRTNALLSIPIMVERGRAPTSSSKPCHLCWTRHWTRAALKKPVMLRRPGARWLGCWADLPKLSVSTQRHSQCDRKCNGRCG